MNISDTYISYVTCSKIHIMNKSPWKTLLFLHFGRSFRVTEARTKMSSFGDDEELAEELPPNQSLQRLGYLGPWQLSWKKSLFDLFD